MKKIINNYKMISAFLVLVIGLSFFSPLIVLAGEGDVTFNFEIEATGVYSFDVGSSGIVVHIKDSSDSYINPVKSDGAPFTTGLDITCSDAAHCTVVVDKSIGSAKFNFESNKMDITYGQNLLSQSTVFSSDTNFSVKTPAVINPGVGGGSDFDGRAVVVWSCGEGVCYHYFDNIPNFDDGNSTFYKDTDVVADNDNTKYFDTNAKYRDWILKDDFDRWVNAYKTLNNVDDIDWSTVDPEDIIGNPPDMRPWEEAAINAGACTKNNTPQDVFERCVDQYYSDNGGGLPFVKLKPVGEPSDKNGYVSYGDRNFKVVIYNSNYRGVTLGDLSELNYYPAYYTNPFLRQDQFDISGTSKEKPYGIGSILLEKTVTLKALGLNGFEIESIEALDVPETAVNITKDGDQFKLVFSSNFYDNVVFKVTDSDGGDNYIQIKRFTIDAWIAMENDKPSLVADFYFDRNNSYSDFDITAKILYKDGSTRKVKLEPVKRVDDGLGNAVNEYEVDEEIYQEFDVKGKGLKKSFFAVNLEDGEDKLIEDIYLNAEYKGSTSSNYAGAYVGSGEGVLANIYKGDE